MRLDELIAAEEAGENAAIEIAGLPTTAARSGPGRCSSACPDSAATVTSSPPARSRTAPWRSSWSGRWGWACPRCGPLGARGDGARGGAFYGDPTSRLKVVGVTGTNGKTTTAFLVRALLEAARRADAACWGRSSRSSAAEERPVDRTTPEAIDLQADFRAMLDGGDRACAMEVSSHALALGRAGGIHFAAAIFTNLTQDHLDFHATMEDYFQAKRLLFLPGDAGLCPMAPGRG